MSAGRESPPPQARPRLRLAWATALVGLLSGLCGCSGWINRNPNYYYDGDGGGSSSWLPGLGLASGQQTYSSLPSHSPIAERRGPFGLRKRRAAAEAEASPDSLARRGSRAHGPSGPSSPSDPSSSPSYPYPNDRSALARGEPRGRAGGPIPVPLAANATPPKSAAEPAPDWPWPSSPSRSGPPVGDPEVAAASNRNAPPESDIIPDPSIAAPDPSIAAPPADLGAPPMGEVGEDARIEAAPTVSKPTAPSKAQVLVDTAQEKLASVRNYQLTMVRRERVGDALLPEESLIFSMRREPQSIRMEWISGANEGREVIYVPRKFSGKLQVRPNKSGLLPSLSISPDNPLIKRSSRHPISEAGLEGVTDRVADSVRRAAMGDPAVGKLTCEGTVSIEDDLSQTFGQIVKQVMPNGEIWLVVFDDEHGLPVLVEGKTAKGELLERYQFRDIRFDLPGLDSDDAFNPDKRWGRGGLFRRLTGGGRSENQPMPPVEPRARAKDETVKPASAGSDGPKIRPAKK